MFTLHGKAMETLLFNLDISLNCFGFFFLMLKSQSSQTKIKQDLGLISGTSKTKEEDPRTGNYILEYNTFGYMMGSYSSTYW